MFKKIRSASMVLALLAMTWMLAAPLFAQQGEQFPPGSMFGNDTAAQRTGRVAAMTAMLDRAFGSTQGFILQRGASAWAAVFGRTVLTADTTFWRRSDGSDITCNGTANASSASAPNCAYSTWNSLYANIVLRYDFDGHNITLKSGTTDTTTSGLAMGFNGSSAWVGGGSLTVDLNGSNIAEATTKGIINSAPQPGGITIQNSAGLGVGGNISSAGFACIQNSAPVGIGIGVGISTGPCFDAAYEATQGGYIALSAPVNSIGAGGNQFVLTALGGNFGFNGQKVNHRSNQTYSLGYATTQFGAGPIMANGATFDLNPAGAGGPFVITGPRYLNSSGFIYTGGSGAAFFPGTVAGTSDSGGCYDGSCGENTLTVSSLLNVTSLNSAANLVISSGATNTGILTSGFRWGFGTTTGALTPTNTQFLIGQNVTAVDAATTALTPLLHLSSSDGTVGSLILDGFGNFPAIAFRRSNGTAASRTVVAAGSIGSFFGMGYDGSAGKYGFGPEIDLTATETWSTTAHGSGIKFFSVVNTTTTQVNSMTLFNSGGLGIGSGAADSGAGIVNAVNGFASGGTVGVTCGAGLSASSRTIKGIVTTC